MEEECGICGDLLKNDENDENNKINKNKQIVTLKCSHKFHFECIQMSYKFANNKQCPYCRKDGGPLEIKNLCQAILKHGKNKGNYCNCKIKNNNSIYCGKHLK